MCKIRRTHVRFDYFARSMGLNAKVLDSMYQQQSYIELYKYTHARLS